MNTIYMQIAEQAVIDAQRDPGTYYPIGINADQVVYNKDEGDYTVACNGDSQEIPTAERAAAALVNMWRQHDEAESERDE